jgi:hypothetical protein
MVAAVVVIDAAVWEDFILLIHQTSPLLDIGLKKDISALSAVVMYQFIQGRT